MELLITGAASPRGKATLLEALAQGHHVLAVISPAEQQPSEVPSHAHLTWLSIDWLEDTGQEAIAAMRHIDAIIHIDEVQTGPFERHYLGTVQTTERLLQAMVRSQVRRLVLTSSLAVYGYGQLVEKQLLDETSPLESAPEQRTPYVQAKLMQEALLCSFNSCWGGQATTLRPGSSYGPEQLWQPILGLATEHKFSDKAHSATLSPESATVQKYWQISPRGNLPLLYTDHFATAAIAALAPIAIGETFNLVDDDLPSRADYGQAISHIIPTPRAKPVPWAIARAAERLQRHTGISLLRLRPGLALPSLNASFKPLRYSNVKAQRMLQWEAKTHWQTVLNQAAQGVTACASDAVTPHQAR